jgi:uncharacterized protein YkwD
MALGLLGVLAGCALPPEAPPIVGGSARDLGDQSQRQIQQRPLREIPRGEVSRIRELIERRRGRFFSRFPGQDSTRLGAVRYDTGAESEIKRLTDQARALSGNVSALQPNGSLRDLARAHSLDMAARGQLSMIASDGKTVTDRLNQAAIPFRDAGIRVHRAPAGSFTLSPSDTDALIIRRRADWLNNSQGNANPLDANYYDVGVGVVRGDDGNLYITAIFRQPPF